ncbi:MAG: hypothetical protein AAGA92_07550 [Planctomycetota bacterium]
MEGMVSQHPPRPARVSSARHAAAISLFAFSLSIATNAAAQSDPSGFERVHNLDRRSTEFTLESNTQINVLEGGRLDEGLFSLQVFEEDVENVEVNMLGGGVRYGLTVPAGVTANLVSGSAGTGLSVYEGGAVNLLGSTFSLGVIDDTSYIGSGGTFNMYAGLIRGRLPVIALFARANSNTHIHGGLLGGRLVLNAGTSLYGQEFKINGEALETGAAITISEGDVLTGTLSDGSVFILSDNTADIVRDVMLVDASLPDLGSPSLELTVDQASKGLRPGYTLTLSEGEALGDETAAVQSTLNVSGGVVGEGFEAYHSTINLEAGNILGSFQAHDGTVVNMTGGGIRQADRHQPKTTFHKGSRLNLDDGYAWIVLQGGTLQMTGGTFSGEARAGSTVNISGGTFNREFEIQGSDVNISGGEFPIFDAEDSRVRISGGSFDGTFVARSGSMIDILGRRFWIDGVPLEPQTVEPITIAERGVTLSGVLADGSFFSFDLNAGAFLGDQFDTSSTVTVTMIVPEPTSTLLLLAGLQTLWSRGVGRLAFT